jgi:hypothetical protein
MRNEEGGNYSLNVVAHRRGIEYLLRTTTEEQVVSPTTASYTGYRALTLAGFLAIAAGALHVVIAFIGYEPFYLGALWFASGGVALALIGVVTLFARNTPAGSIERWVAVGANAAGFLIALAYSLFNRWREPRGYVEMAIFLIGLVAAMQGGRQTATATEPVSQRRA